MKARMMAVAGLAAVLLTAGGTAMAEVTIETVPVGNPSNADDTHGDGYGGVSYSYNIGKYEVTNDQYSVFLNAVAATDTYELYNTRMGGGDYDCGGIIRSGSPGSYIYSVRPDRSNTPVTYVDWYSSMRFANWLQNGQLTGAQVDGVTEDGTYDFSGATSVTIPNHATFTVPHVALTSEDEWYKAAYYKRGSTAAGYWDYATQSDTLPTAVPPPGGTNSASYEEAVGGFHLTEVGAYTNSPSAYGTFDQNGNVNEWTESLKSGNPVYRGGAWLSYAWPLAASGRDWDSPFFEGYGSVGFRVAVVPEPATLALLTLGGLALVRRRKQPTRHFGGRFS